MVLSKRFGIRYGVQAWVVRAVINVALVVGPLALVTAGKQLLGLA
jgi:hypothetical protein